MYEKWIELQDPNILEEIRRYNEQDCRSLPLLRDWLIQDVFPKDTKYLENIEISDVDHSDESESETDEADSAQIILDSLRKYHTREAKPYWWGHFDALVATDGDLILDTSVLAACSQINSAEKLYQFSFPEQEHKFSVGDQVSCLMPAIRKSQSAVITSLDEDEGEVEIRSTRPLIETIHIRETSPPPHAQIETRLSDVSFQYKNSIGDLRKTPVLGCVERLSDDIDQNDLNDDYCLAISQHPKVKELGGVTFVQGPPGSGKTYQGAKFINELAQTHAGKICLVTAQSHKAIENLIEKASTDACSDKIVFIKFGKPPQKQSANISYISKYEELAQIVINRALKRPDISIVIGITVFGICKLYNEYKVPQADHLIIDEAGQYSLANAVACASVAKGAILLGDQNQLPNVVQGTHPNDVGASVMSFCLGENSVVMPKDGLFLGETRRLHPRICSFISDKFYRGKLRPHPITETRKLIKTNGARAEVSGIHLEILSHFNSSQRCSEEADHILNLVASLKSNCEIEIGEDRRSISDTDFIIIAPFNAQVKLLQSKLGDTLKVGTVDKFQGQEAPICIVSMTASSGADAPKGLEFLLNKNRLNVAISRAQVGCFVVCSSELFSSQCNSIKQMELLSIFTSLKRYSNMQARN